MDRQHVGGGDPTPASTHRSRRLLRPPRSQVGTPRYDVHPERGADPRHPAADSTQTQHAQHGAAELPADGGLPAVTAHRLRLIDDPAGRCQNQRPGELHRRLDVAAGGADVDAVFFGGRDIDRGIERSGRGDHSQSR